MQDLASKNQLSLIAINEAHLLYQCQEFRPAYKELKTLKDEFLQVLTMLLTATAPLAWGSVSATIHCSEPLC